MLKWAINIVRLPNQIAAGLLLPDLCCFLVKKKKCVWKGCFSRNIFAATLWALATGTSWWVSKSKFSIALAFLTYAFSALHCKKSLTIKSAKIEALKAGERMELRCKPTRFHCNSCFISSEQQTRGVLSPANEWSRLPLNGWGAQWIHNWGFNKFTSVSL